MLIKKPKVVKRKARKRGRKKLKPVNRTAHDNLVADFHDSMEKLRELEGLRVNREQAFRQRENQLENNLADAYEEHQRLFTVISTLGKHIQNLERIIRNRNNPSLLSQSTLENNYTQKQQII